MKDIAIRPDSIKYTNENRGKAFQNTTSEVFPVILLHWQGNKK